MKSIAIRNRSITSELWSRAVRTVPRQWLQVFAGPVSRLTIGPDGVQFDKHSPAYRPVEVDLAPTLVLSKRLTIPPAGRQDLRYAVELLVRSETPFAPEDLLVDVEFSGITPDGDALTYDIRLAPRARILDALRKFQIRSSRVRTIGVVGDVGAPRSPEFAAALMPSRRWRRWMPLLPVLAILAAGAALAQSELGARHEWARQLQQLAIEKLAEVRVVGNELANRRTALGQGQAAEEALASSVSAFRVLQEIRTVLPAATELDKIEMRDRAVRLSVRTENALQDAKTFGDNLRNWTVSIEGTISVDQTSRTESAVILLQPLT